MKNVNLLNDIKHEANAKEDYEESKKKLSILSQKTGELEKTTDVIKKVAFNRAKNLQELEQRYLKSLDIYEKNKEKFKRLMDDLKQRELQEFNKLKDAVTE